MDINSIPIMTHPYSKYWEQPDTSEIIIDDKHALMDKKTMKALHEYSLTNPTGAYEGKMWRAQYKGKWFLRWYGVSEEKGMVSNNQREIILSA